MGTYIGNNANNYFKAHTEKGGFLNLFNVWKSWTMSGNGGNDTLIGGPKNDTIYGNSGNDYLYGNGGNDYLSGGSGNDYLDGSTGNDTMYGGTGNDTFVVNSTGDVVTEYLNQGIDRVNSSISYSLGANLENLTLTGTAYYGYGNSLNNSISGNNSNNYLWGADGNDIINGGAGADTLVGGTGNDSLTGGTGNDSLTGGSGADILWGGTGADKFIFNYLFEGIDIIKDFQWTEGDKIQVSGSGFGASSLNQFSYNSLTGALFFDPSGSTGPTQFVTIENKPAGFSVNLDIVIV